MQANIGKVLVLDMGQALSDAVQERLAADKAMIR